MQVQLWTPVFLERLYGALTKTGADFAVCLFRRFQGEPPKELPAAVETEVLSQSEAFECLFNICNENMVVAPNKLYKREIFDITHYPLGQIHEDEAVIHEIIGCAKTMAWILPKVSCSSMWILTITSPTTHWKRWLPGKQLSPGTKDSAAW